MNIDGKAWRTIWLEEGGRSVGVIDQTLLPHRFETRSLATTDQVAQVNKLLGIVKVDDDDIQKWFSKADVDGFEDMTDEQIGKVISFLDKKLGAFKEAA
jgi:hypothetical protein